MILNLIQSRGDLTCCPRRHSPGPDGRSPSAPVPEARVIPGKGGWLPGPPRPKAGCGSPTLARRYPGGSWWTARAASTVQPGFTKGEILAEAPFDPSTPGGLFERLGSLLEQLTQSLVASSDGGRLKY
jgi:hypothetical protein